MVFVDLPKGLLVLGLSFPLDFAPPWNEKNPIFLNVLLSFCNFFFDDNRAILVFYPNDPNFLRDIMGYLANNNFKIQQKWMVINMALKLSNARDPSKMVCFNSSNFIFLSIWPWNFNTWCSNFPSWYCLGPCVHFKIFISIKFIGFHLHGQWLVQFIVSYSRPWWVGPSYLFDHTPQSRTYQDNQKIP